MHKLSLLCLVILFPLAATAQDAGAPKPAEAKPEKAPASVPSPAERKQNKALGIPDDAERLDATHYRYKDSHGVTWNYTKTPFGLNKEQVREASPAGTPAKRGITATLHGDEIVFSHQGPFGPNTWTKKKSDALTAEEQQAVDAIGPNAAPTHPDPAVKKN